MNNDKNNKLTYIIIIAILVIIILVLLFFTKFGRIESKLVPTGNVDMFNIDIDCNCDSEGGNEELPSPEREKVKPKSKSNSNTVVKKECNKDSIPVFDEVEAEEAKDDDYYLGKVFVSDKNGDYVYQQNLKIFENAAFEYENKIAPGTANSYQFVVHNNMDINLKYYVEMVEKTKYPINIKYRLRRNGSYVVGNDNKWVSASELKTAFSRINASGSDNYTLDWHWLYNDGKDEMDTYAGKNMNDTYKLNIRFYFEEIE